MFDTAYCLSIYPAYSPSYLPVLLYGQALTIWKRRGRKGERGDEGVLQQKSIYCKLKIW